MPTEVSKILVRLNGSASMTSARTMQELLVEQGLAEQKVATALNGTFVPARTRSQQPLQDGDHVEVVSARQGG